MWISKKYLSSIYSHIHQVITYHNEREDHTDEEKAQPVDRPGDHVSCRSRRLGEQLRGQDVGDATFAEKEEEAAIVLEFVWKQLSRRLLEEIISVEYLGPSQNSRWKQTRTPCSGKEPQDWHSGRTTGREIAVYDHNINLVESHINGSHFAWSFAFCFYNSSVCLPEKWGWVWIKCSRCSSVCSRQRWALSFPDFLWGNPVRHTQ